MVRPHVANLEHDPLYNGHLGSRCTDLRGVFLGLLFPKLMKGETDRNGETDEKGIDR